MKKKTKAVLSVILILLIGGSGYFGYSYWYDSVHYFKTDNASVTANTVTITPLVSGNVLSWDIKEGDNVSAGQKLGRQDLENLIQSNNISTDTLMGSAGTNISKADIKTPISGKVVQSNVVVGETIAPGMEAAIVADTDHMYIKANVEEYEINRIKEGQKVNVKIDAYPGVKFTGYVESIGEATQSAFSQSISFNTSGTFTKVTQLVPVKINVANLSDYKLRMGYNATVKIKTK